MKIRMTSSGMRQPSTTGGSLGGLAAELALARDLVRRAGRAAMRHYGRAAVVNGSAGSPVTAADLAANRVILDGLRSALPGDAVLSEESRDTRARLSAERVWIVDPLDGTKEFLEENGEFAVMLGLVRSGEPVVGAVYLPALEILYSAVRGGGAWVERGGATRPLRAWASGGSGLRLASSRSHPPALLGSIQRALDITEVRPSGSVGVKCALVAEGDCDLYVHPVPYLKEWDTCGPELILREAGGNVTDCLGRPLGYNKAEPVQAHGILACGPAVSAETRARVVDLYTAAAGHAALTDRAATPDHGGRSLTRTERLG